KLAVVAKAERAAINADRAILRLFRLADSPILQLGELGRFVLLRQALLGRLEMRVAGAAPPQIAFGIVLLGLELRIGLARALARHRHLDAALALEGRGHAAAPFFLDRAIDDELTLRRRRHGRQLDDAANAERHRR